MIVALLAGALAACSDPDPTPTAPLPDASQEDDASGDTTTLLDSGADASQDAVSVEPDVFVEPCDVEYVLPPGESYALKLLRVSKPTSLASLINQQVGSVPPILLFADGLSDGQADDPVAMVGGIGVRTSFGFDDTPDTEHDIFAMDYRSISTSTCGYAFDLIGACSARVLTSSANFISIDLGGFSTATAGVSLRVDEVEFDGTFNEPLNRLEEITLKGLLSDEGVDALLEAVRDRIPMSKEQIMRLLDPDNTGIIPVEMHLEGRKVVVEGFTTPQSNEKADVREEEACCPTGAAIGDPIYPYLTWQDQGIQDDERELFQLALNGLRADVNVAMIATAERDEDSGEVTYQIYSGGAVLAGELSFKRVAGEDGGPQTYETVRLSGQNPLQNVDPFAFGTVESFLDAAINPNDARYANQGYGVDDTRVGFVPVDEMSYPFAFERIAQNFDDPRTGDFLAMPASYAKGGIGNHGHLGSLQSRSPLFISGPGIRNAASAPDSGATVHQLLDGPDALLVDDVARIVDIAPTIAAALGIAKTTGVGPDGRFSDDVYLKWQDGRVLQEVFTEEAWAKIQNGEPVAERAIIIVNDGLTNIEILYQALSQDPEFDVDTYHRLLGRGLAYRYGSITNYPSNTYPSHNSLGAGAWAGHHGIIDNSFWIREKGITESPIRDIFETEYLLGSAHPKMPVETLHEAVVRSFGTLAETGNLAASINEPSSRGAELATLEKRYPAGFVPPSSADVVTIGLNTYPLPLADITDYGGVLDNASLQTFARVFLDHERAVANTLPVPRFTMVNFGSTDSAGHAYGPHGDQERHVVIARVNERLRIMLAVLEHLDLLDTTMIVLTSDHGMELQDTTRPAWTGASLATAGIRFRDVGASVYLKQLGSQVVSRNLSAGQGGSVTLKVIDHDSRFAEIPVAAPAVTVRVIDGAGAAVATTDDDGLVTLELLVDENATDVLLEFESDQWNTHRVRVSVGN
ncbi:MAG: alkaline phosphatase family protein [Bradymonadaceae bacterium]|nr:alkaline phosphatase family protein [Lujinxingiaceae bacterium]